MPNTPINPLWFQQFATGENIPHALIYAAGYLWIGMEVSPGKMIRMDPNNPSTYQTITFPNDGVHQWIMDIIYIPSKNRIYPLFGGFNTQAVTVVSEVNPDTLSVVDVINSDFPGDAQGSLTCDGTWLYVCNYTSASITRWTIADWGNRQFLKVDFMGLGPTGPHCIRYDDVTGKVFCTSAADQPGGNIVRIDPVTFTVEQIGGVGFNTILTDDLAFTHDYVWCGSEKTGQIVRYLKTDLSQSTAFGTGAGGTCWCVYFDGTWIWAGYRGGPGLIAQVNPTTLAVTVFEWPLSPQQASPNEIWYNNGVLYFTFYTTPGAAAAIQLGTSIFEVTRGVGDDLNAFADSENAVVTNTGGGGGGSTGITITISDGISFLDEESLFAPGQSPAVSATLVLSDAAFTEITAISSPPTPGSGDPGGPSPGAITPLECIFEFYEMETPEDVEVLPVPKKYDQLGPMRFDKIGKLFGFRVRLIQTGSVAAMPFAIYGDDSESSPYLNSILYQGTFPVAAGVDEVYEIQLPKSINSDIFRLTLGPVSDPFHRYDGQFKIHNSGMPGQAKWLQVR